MKSIEVHHLKKSYGDHLAVKGIDFSVEAGELFAFLGANGAGKSTTINILCMLLEADDGEVVIDGYDLKKHREVLKGRMGVVFQNGVLDDALTVEENLYVRASLYGLKKTKLKSIVRETITEMGLQDYADRRYGTLSGGQKRRTDIARALISRPRILFLDEPTAGLDPQAKREIWKKILTLKQEKQMTVFLTTHDMEEAMQADHIVIMDQGQIKAEGTPFVLRQQYTKDRLTIIPKRQDWVLDIPHTVDRGALVVELTCTLDAISILNRYQDEIADFEVTKGKLDDVLVRIIGKEDK